MLAALASAAPAATAATPTGRLLVTLAPHQRPQAVAAMAGAGTHVAGPVVPDLGLVTVRPAPGTGLRAAADRLRRRRGVERVEIEHRYSPRYVPNDPSLSTAETAPGTAPGTPVEWWVAKENFPAAWDVSRGDGVKIAVIDQGIDASHPELVGKVVGGADDDAIPGDGPAGTDEYGHGTMVASIACARGDDALSIVGAGLNCSLYDYKSDLTEASVAQAITQATNAGVDAINMSFGTDGTQPAATVVVDAIKRAAAKGIVMVAAAADTETQEQGDPGNVLQPTNTGADLTQGLGLDVTAATFADQRAGFAGYGSQISMAAYGTYSTTTGPTGLLGAFPANTTELETGATDPASKPCLCRTTVAGDNRYAYLQGTSFAAPMVAAAAGLMHHLNPDLTASEIAIELKSTATRPAGAGWTQDLGWGILDAGAALSAAQSTDRHRPSTRVRRAVRRGSRVTLTLAGTDLGPAGVLHSGLAKIQVYRRIGGSPSHLVATVTTGRSVRVRLVGGADGFFTVGTDRAGNREKAPIRPDVRITVRR